METLGVRLYGTTVTDLVRARLRLAHNIDVSPPPSAPQLNILVDRQSNCTA